MTLVANSPESLGWRSVNWYFDNPDGGTTTTMSADYFVLNENPSAILLGGLGDGRDGLERAVRYLGNYGINVAGVSLNYPNSSEQAINSTLRYAIPEVIYDINEKNELDGFRPLDIYGISQGGGEAIVAMALGVENGLKIYGGLKVLSSVGPGNKAFAKRPASIFNKRRKIQPTFLAPGLKNTDTVNSETVRRLIYALSHDNCQQLLLNILNDGHSVLVGFAELDTIFRPNEGEAGLAEINNNKFQTLRLKGGHTSLIRMAGRIQLLEFLRYKK